MRVTTTIAAAALLAAGAGTARAQQINESRNTGPTGTVEVRNAGGAVRVLGWSRNQVQVTGTLGSAAERVVIEDEDEGIVVRVLSARGSHSPSRGTNLEVRVPARKDVEVHGFSAPVTVEGIDGDVDAQSVSGNVRVSGGRARVVSAASRSGDVLVDMTMGSGRKRGEASS